MAKKPQDQRLFDQWDKWIGLIYQDFQELVIRRHVYEEVRKIIQTNPRLHKPSSFYDFMQATFSAFAALSVRRQSEASARRLLDSVKQHPEILSRERFVETYTSKMLAGFAGHEPVEEHVTSSGGAYMPSAAEVSEIASKTFDQYVGPGAPHVDPAQVRAELDELRAKAKRLEHLADKRIAHLTDEPTEIPTLPELDSFIETFERIVHKYMMILRASAPVQVLPSWQYDWKAIFKEPWIP